MKIKRKGEKAICELIEQQVEGEKVTYISFPGLRSTGVAEHLFSTRLGGVSKGIYASMNLSFLRGDEKQAVDKNFERIAKCLGCSVEDIVCSDQTHTDHIRKVTKEDKGKGVVREKDYQDIDGLITNEPGIALATFFADCVPLFFIDPVKKAIGMTHSGWRGTVEKIGKKTVEAMEREYGCNPKDIVAAVGPSICQDCYEVSEDVIEKIKEAFETSLWEKLFYPTKAGKYQLNLWETNYQVMLEAGLLPEHIEVTDLCTCCNSSLLFSHRASQGKRGNLGAFLMLR